MALDGQFQSGIDDKRSASSLRWSITDFWYTRDYGFVCPKPKELSPKTNLFLALDDLTWMWLGLALVSAIFVYTAMYLAEGLSKIKWVSTSSL